MRSKQKKQYFLISSPGNSSKTYILNILLQEKWTEGPALHTLRYDLRCGRIRLNNNSNKMSIIAVTGRYNGVPLSSTEILDEGGNGNIKTIFTQIGI
jgi:hypothetical protein